MIRLIGRSTVEEIILKRAEDKLRLTEAVIVAGQSTSATGVKGYSDELKVRIFVFARLIYQIRIFVLRNWQSDTCSHEEKSCIVAVSVLQHRFSVWTTAAEALLLDAFELCHNYCLGGQ